MNLKKLLAWVGSFLVTVAVSAFFLVQYRADLPEIVANYVDRYILQGIDDAPLSLADVEKLQLLTDGEYEVYMGRAEFGLPNAYGTSSLTPPERPRLMPPNFRQVGGAIFWPSDCNLDGCRYDVFRPTAPEDVTVDDFIGTIRAYYLLQSKNKRNGVPIFVDSGRRAHWWDGIKFQVSPATRAVNTAAQCKNWISRPESDSSTVAKNTTVSGVLASHLNGGYFLMRRAPICWEGGGERYVQSGGSEIQLIYPDREYEAFFKQALELVGEVEVKCSWLYIPETAGYTFSVACEVAAISGHDTWRNPKTVSVK